MWNNLPKHLQAYLAERKLDQQWHQLLRQVPIQQVRYWAPSEPLEQWAHDTGFRKGQLSVLRALGLTDPDSNPAVEESND